MYIRDEMCDQLRQIDILYMHIRYSYYLLYTLFIARAQLVVGKKFSNRGQDGFYIVKRSQT